MEGVIARALPQRFMGRRLVVTSLDPLPVRLRTMPGALAVRQGELDDLKRGPAHIGSGATFKMLARFCYRADGGKPLVGEAEC